MSNSEKKQEELDLEEIQILKRKTCPKCTHMGKHLFILDMENWVWVPWEKSGCPLASIPVKDVEKEDIKDRKLEKSLNRENAYYLHKKERGSLLPSYLKE